MSLSGEIDVMYKDLNNTMNEINKNIILLIENTNKIVDYTFNKIKNGLNEINNIHETLDEINRDKQIDENINIQKIRKILYQLETLQKHEESNRSITIKD